METEQTESLCPTQKADLVLKKSPYVKKELILTFEKVHYVCCTESLFLHCKKLISYFVKKTDRPWGKFILCLDKKINYRS